MEDIVSQAKAELVRAKERIARDLATTPDDRINWSPASTARTPLQLVAHVATSIDGIRRVVLLGEPMPWSSFAEAEVAWRKDEKQYTTREQVLELLDSAVAGYNAWLDTLTSEQLAGTARTPFGRMPMAAAITIPADHIRGHAAQLEYIQTIYGDHDWHM